MNFFIMVYFGREFTLSAWAPSCFIPRLWPIDLNIYSVSFWSKTSISLQKGDRAQLTAQYVPKSNLKQGC